MTTSKSKTKTWWKSPDRGIYENELLLGTERDRNMIERTQGYGSEGSNKSTLQPFRMSHGGTSTERTGRSRTTSFANNFGFLVML